MANTRSAAKRARQIQRRTIVNRRVLSNVKNQLKSVRTMIQGTEKEKAREAVQRFISSIDKAVKSGRIHRNSARRHKSAVTRALAKSSAGSAPSNP
jgi:small subunit ribosomal protein S20